MRQGKLDRLNGLLDTFPRLLVAYSGGADSAFLLAAAHRRMGSRVLGIVADSPSLARPELEAALVLGKKIGAMVEVVQTDEFSNPDYLSNPINRCYFCKHALFTRMEDLAKARGYPVLAYGENADDVGESRPGSKAAVEFQVRAPLKEAGLGKEDVRELSRQWGLATAEKPSSPCLSSRIPHGTPVTEDALRKIEAGEEALRALGFRVFRLRHHGEKARVEFAPEELIRASMEPWEGRVRQAVLAAGYDEVNIDPQGYQGVIR